MRSFMIQMSDVRLTSVCRLVSHRFAPDERIRALKSVRRLIRFIRVKSVANCFTANVGSIALLALPLSVRLTGQSPSSVFRRHQVEVNKRLSGSSTADRKGTGRFGGPVITPHRTPLTSSNHEAKSGVADRR